MDRECRRTWCRRTLQPLHPTGERPTSLKASYDAGIGSAAHGIRFKAVVGFVAGAGFEITTQLASGKSLSEVDVSDVLVSGAVGAVLGGPIGAVAKAGTVAPKISTSVKAVKTLSDQASRARTAARLAKIESRIQGNAEKIMNQAGEVVVTASKAIAGVFVKNEAKDAANGTQAPTPTKEDAGSDQVPKQAERENNR